MKKPFVAWLFIILLGLSLLSHLFSIDSLFGKPLELLSTIAILATGGTLLYFFSTLQKKARLWTHIYYGVLIVTEIVGSKNIFYHHNPHHILVGSTRLCKK